MCVRRPLEFPTFPLPKSGKRKKKNPEWLQNHPETKKRGQWTSNVWFNSFIFFNIRFKPLRLDYTCACTWRTHGLWLCCSSIHLGLSHSDFQISFKSAELTKKNPEHCQVWWVCWWHHKQHQPFPHALGCHSGFCLCCICWSMFQCVYMLLWLTYRTNQQSSNTKNLLHCSRVLLKDKQCDPSDRGFSDTILALVIQSWF